MKSKARVIIVDDEPDACKNVAHFINERYSDKIEIVGVAHSAGEAEYVITDTNPDCIFIDINMPGEDAFSLLERISPYSFKTVFVTAYDTYALKAFRENALDYILKPICDDHLFEACDRLLKAVAVEEKKLQYIDSKSKKDAILVRTGSSVLYILCRNIVYVEAANALSVIYYLKDYKICKATYYKSLGELEMLLSGNGFFRCHKKYLVNLLYARKTISGINPQVVLFDGISVTVARRRYTEMLKLLAT